MLDPKTNVNPLQIVHGGILSVQTDSEVIDFARFETAVVVFNVVLATGTASVVVQDSDDGLSFADVSGTGFAVPGATANAEYFLHLRGRDLRRYVRVRITPGTNITCTATAVQVGATSPPDAVTWTVDSSTL